MAGNSTKIRTECQKNYFNAKKHNLTIDYLITNGNDSEAISNMVESTVEITGHNQFIGLDDKGYHTGTELKHGADHASAM
ncbi:MAG: hypothetical protein FJ344_08120 [Sphingomonadales bacterium]|nr:hypothetical protein [Sphingomonadales bacterium]